MLTDFPGILSCGLVAKEAPKYTWENSIAPSYVANGSRLILDLKFSRPEKVVVVDETF